MAISPANTATPPTSASIPPRDSEKATQLAMSVTAKQAANEGFSLRQALAEDCEFICKQADTVMMLPGWEKSNGAQAEQRLAVALQSEGVEIVYLSEPLCVIMEQAAKHFAQQQVEFAERAKAGENALA